LIVPCGALRVLNYSRHWPDCEVVEVKLAEMSRAESHKSLAVATLAVR